MTSPKTPQDVAHMAAEDCAVNWCIGDNENREGKHCMLGAINVAAGVPVDLYGITEWDQCRKEELEFSGDGHPEHYPPVDPEALALRDDTLKLVVRAGGLPDHGGPVGTVFSFNDVSSQNEVVSVLRKAAEAE